MTSGHRWDPLVLSAIAITGLVTGFAVQISRQQDEPLAWWFFAGLAVATLLGAYGTARSVPRRTAALIGSGVILLGLGVLAILTIGLPLIGAGVLTVVAAARSAGTVDQLSTRWPWPLRAWLRR